MAGMLIAETEYRYQIDAAIRPFRDLLLGLFFVTVGMQLDLGVRRCTSFGWVLLALAVPVAGKMVLIALLTRVLRQRLGGVGQDRLLSRRRRASSRSC